jgi:hypothetical protein
MTNAKYTGMALSDVLVEPSGMAEYPFLVRKMTAWGLSDGTLATANTFEANPGYKLLYQQDGASIYRACAQEAQPQSSRPCSENAGFIESRPFVVGDSSTGINHTATIVIYLANEAGIDVGGKKYAISCEKHNCVVGATSLRRARQAMRDADFCEACMKIAAEDVERFEAWVLNQQEDRRDV